MLRPVPNHGLERGGPGLIAGPSFLASFNESFDEGPATWAVALVKPARAHPVGFGVAGLGWFFAGNICGSGLDFAAAIARVGFSVAVQEQGPLARDLLGSYSPFGWCRGRCRFRRRRRGGELAGGLQGNQGWAELFSLIGISVGQSLGYDWVFRRQDGTIGKSVAVRIEFFSGLAPKGGQSHTPRGLQAA